MNKKIFTGVTLAIYLALFPSYSNANQLEQKIDTQIVEKNYVTELQDGRIEAIQNPEDKLDDNEKDNFLVAMNFNKDEISLMSDQEKNEIISKGGIKVNINTEDYEESYTDLQGENHSIDSKNKSEIEQIKQNDLKSLGIPQNKSLMGSDGKGIFKGSGSLIYIGKTANAKEFKYSYRTNFSWSALPIIATTDRVGMAWQSGVTGVGSKGVFQPVNGFKSIDESSVYGVHAKFKTLTSGGSGYLASEIRIPVSLKGTTGLFASAYTHPYSDVPGSATIGPVSIVFSELGDKFSWKNSFIIGSTS